MYHPVPVDEEKAAPAALSDGTATSDRPAQEETDSVSTGLLSPPSLRNSFSAAYGRRWRRRHFFYPSSYRDPSLRDYLPDSSIGIFAALCGLGLVVAATCWAAIATTSSDSALWFGAGGRAQRTDRLDDDWTEPRRKRLADYDDPIHTRKVPGVTELLQHTEPALSLYDNLRPNHRYLMCDSWSGLTGQFTTVLPLLLLASMTQRIAILPSFQDEWHYGRDVIVNMSLLYDMERFRNLTGILFVEQDEVKQRDPDHTLTRPDEIGCYHASYFENALSFGHHNILQTVFQTTNLPFTYEAFVTFDSDFDTRMKQTRAQLGKDGMPTELPRNLEEGTKTWSLLCYTNLWDLKHAGDDQVSNEQRRLMNPIWSGYEPEWFHVGRYIDFAPKVWTIALESVKKTLNVEKIPKDLITMHIRRGDFLTWCSEGKECTPTLDLYKSALDDIKYALSFSHPWLKPDDLPVLVTTDERENRAILDQIDAFGWIRSTTSPATLEAAYGEAWKWAESAVDQAILSLGTVGFVGTGNSQVSQVTKLRIETYYRHRGAQTRMVEKPRP